MLTGTSQGKVGPVSQVWRRWFTVESRTASVCEQPAASLLTASLRQPVRIEEILGPAELRQRLLALGFTPGCDVTVLAHGPLGGPLAVSCRGAIVALRRREAGCIRVA